MRQFGTDALAMAVIVGGAAVGGASTLLFSETPSEVGYECSTVVELQRQVIVAVGGGQGSVIVTSNVENDGSDACATTVRVHRLRIERAQEAGARARVAVERIVRVKRIHVQGLEDMDFDFDFEGMTSDFEEMNLQLEGMNFEFQDLRELMREMEALQVLEVQREGLDVQMDDEELHREIERRIEEALRKLKDRLGRLDEEIGR